MGGINADFSLNAELMAQGDVLRKSKHKRPAQLPASSILAEMDADRRRLGLLDSLDDDVTMQGLQHPGPRTSSSSTSKAADRGPSTTNSYGRAGAESALPDEESPLGIVSRADAAARGVTTSVAATALRTRDARTEAGLLLDDVFDSATSAQQRSREAGARPSTAPAGREGPLPDATGAVAGAVAGDEDRRLDSAMDSVPSEISEDIGGLMVFSPIVGGPALSSSPGSAGSEEERRVGRQQEQQPTPVVRAFGDQPRPQTAASSDRPTRRLDPDSRPRDVLGGDPVPQSALPAFQPHPRGGREPPPARERERVARVDRSADHTRGVDRGRRLAASQTAARPPSRGGESWAPFGQTEPPSYEQLPPEEYGQYAQLREERIEYDLSVADVLSRRGVVNQ